MASPLGHGLLGYALGRLGRPQRTLPAATWSALAVFAALAPDFDLLAGLAVGDFIRHLGSRANVETVVPEMVIIGSALMRTAAD